MGNSVKLSLSQYTFVSNGILIQVHYKCAHFTCSRRSDELVEDFQPAFRGDQLLCGYSGQICKIRQHSGHIGKIIPLPVWF